MRIYWWPRGSRWGVSTGCVGGLLLMFVWILLAVFCIFFVWPFQFIWQALPQMFPNSRSLPAWQVGLTTGWAAFLVVAVVIGGSHAGGSSSTGGSSSSPTVSTPATTATTTAASTTATPRGPAASLRAKATGICTNIWQPEGRNFINQNASYITNAMAYDLSQIRHSLEPLVRAHPARVAHQIATLRIVMASAITAENAFDAAVLNVSTGPPNLTVPASVTAAVARSMSQLQRAAATRDLAPCSPIINEQTYSDAAYSVINDGFGPGA